MFWDTITSSAEKVKTDLGTVLQKMGLVSPEDVEMAASRQKHQDRSKIGAVMVGMGLITEAQLADALSKQKRMRHGKAAEVMAELVEARHGALLEHVLNINASTK
jgi:hypothetical protein